MPIISGVELANIIKMNIKNNVFESAKVIATSEVDDDFLQLFDAICLKPITLN